MAESKRLGHYDESGFKFVQEILGDTVTAGINFDRIQYHPDKGYIIFEFLLCDEKQQVTPWTSHPNRYWNKNKMKFIRLWQLAKDIPVTLYLVNYAKSGTIHQDKVKVIKVSNIIDEIYPYVLGEEKNCSREEFREWFVKLNNKCLSDPRLQKKNT